LSHHGILFLDELPEFHREVLEVLRQPMEDGSVTIARAAQSLSFPSRFQLVAAMNPCPCGFYGDHRRPCVCSPNQIRKYLTRISGPLLDRIDLHVAVPRLLPDELMSKQVGESSATVRQRVCRARDIQLQRFENKGINCNAHMRAKQLREYCNLDSATADLLKNAIDQFAMSARAHDRILKVARTIADLENSAEIQLQHIAEAVNYRTLDRKLFA
jgi:magnesium chelatase family protein